MLSSENNNKQTKSLKVLQKIESLKVPKKASFCDSNPLLSSLLLSSLISSSCVIFISCILLSKYHLYLFSFISHLFLLCPLTLLISSVSSSICSFMGLIVIMKKIRTFIVTLGGISCMLMILTLAACVLSTLMICSAKDHMDLVYVDDILGSGDQNETDFLLWDQIQNNYECCGVRGPSGYDQWRPILENTYPDSCCTLKYPGCGQEAMATLYSDFANTFPDRIFTIGCITVLG